MTIPAMEPGAKPDDGLEVLRLAEAGKGEVLRLAEAGKGEEVVASSVIRYYV